MPSSICSSHSGRRSLGWIFLAAALLGAGVPALAQQPASIRIGISTAGVGSPPRVQTGTLAVAQSQGLIEQEFKADGIRIEWIFFKGEGPASNEALSNNQIDFASQGGLPSIVGRSVGLDTRVVFAPSSRSNTYLAVRPDSPVKSVAELRGKRIAFHKGTATQLAVNRILEAHGLSEKEVRVVNLDPAAAAAAMQAGDLDAIFGTVTLLKLRDAGHAKIVYNTREVPVASSPSHVVVNQAFAKKYPEHTKRMVKALVKAAYWAGQEKNREEVFRLWASAGSVTQAQFREDYAGMPLAHRLSPLIDPFVLARDREAVEDAYRYKLIRRKFDVDAWIDRSYLDAALKELGLKNHWPRFDAGGKPLGPA